MVEKRAKIESGRPDGFAPAGHPQPERRSRVAMSAVSATAAAPIQGKGSETDPSQLFRWIFPALGVASLVASCVLWSLRKQMWGDEVFTVTELRDPSLLHLMRAVPRLGGAGMPLFYLTAWPWAHLFGFSDLSLRLYSSAGVCAAFIVLFLAMRRRFGAAAAFVGVAFGFFASLIVVEQNCEARGYGLYLLLAALAIAQALNVAEREKPRARDLVLLALTQAGLVFGHILGVLYAGLILLGLVAADLLRADLRPQRLRLRVYLSCVAGWLALIPWIPAIKASAAVGHPHGWIGVPTFGDLAASLSLWLFTGLYWQLHPPAAIIVAGWFLALACLAVLTVVSMAALRTAQQGAVYLVGFAFIFAPLLFFVISRVASPIFLPRYLIPSALGVAMLAAAALQRSSLGKGIAVIALSIALLGFPIATALLARPVALDVRRIDQIADGRIVVSDSLKDFMVMTRYRVRPELVQYPLDQAAADTVPGADADVRLLTNYRREGFLVANLPEPAEILQRKSILLLDTPGAPWFRVRIEGNPRFTWKVIAQLGATRRLIEVEQVAPATLQP